ncbi:MAG: CDP-diacylglycerol--glycerol-3-phosphate 3-phosphatidyltransferase [Bdellovibrionales bacterium]
MSTESVRPRWQTDLPMFFTYLRIAMAPVVMGVLYIPWVWAGWTAAILFIIGSFTDWLDGYFARRFNVESTAGKFMDPIADKLLVLGAIVMLLAMNRVDAFMVFLLLARDTFIGGVRSVAAANQIIIAAKPFGKWKTAMQMLGVPCLLIYDPLFGVVPLARIGYGLLWVSVVLSLISGVEYTVGYYRQTKK